jgi:hypothetical protein
VISSGATKKRQALQRIHEAGHHHDAQHPAHQVQRPAHPQQGAGPSARQRPPQHQRQRGQAAHRGDLERRVMRRERLQAGIHQREQGDRDQHQQGGASGLQGRGRGHPPSMR